MRIVASLVLGGVLLGIGAPARAQDPEAEALAGVAAALANIGYTPAKVVTAAFGMVAGGVVGLLTGGSTRATYGVMVPLSSGDFYITPDHLIGSRPLEFLGTDYADQPSQYDRENEGSRVYDAAYTM